MSNIIFIHGLDGSGQGFKGQFFRKLFPSCLTPDFKKYSPGIPYQILLKERMLQLNSIMKDNRSWIIIGSSFGGLMGALYTCQFPEKVAHLILLAPALAIPELDPKRFSPVKVPVIIYHGKRDKTIPIKSSCARAKKLFINLTYNVVDDDHMLHTTVKNIDWKKLVKI